MTTTATKRAAALCALLATTSLASPVLGQTQPPPVYPTLDDNGVDVVSGRFNFSLKEASIGSGDGELALVRTWAGTDWNDDWMGNLYVRTEAGVSVQYIILGEQSIKFSKVGTAFVPAKANGETLVQNGTAFTYTSRDGVQYMFSDPTGGTSGYPCNEIAADRCYLLRTITEPSGKKTGLQWQTVFRCGDITCGVSRTSSRLTGVENNFGYRVQFTYAIASFSGLAPPIGWAQRTSATLHNKAVCGPGPADCGGSPQTWPTVTYTPQSSTDNPADLTDPAGRKWHFTTGNGGGGIAVRRPGSSVNNISFSTNGAISTLTREGVTYSYSRAVAGNSATLTRTDPNGNQTVVVTDVALGRPISVRDELNRVTTYAYDANGRLTEVTYPEGNKIKLTLDARGNVTETRRISKTAGSPADVVTTAGYDLACANPVTCNKPNWTRDAAGHQTDYVYGASHGGALSMTSPAASVGGIRPQTRFSYSSLQAQYKNINGAVAASGLPVYMLSAVSACRSTASCVGGADEVRSTISYGTQSAGVANNLLVESSSAGSGDGALVATRSYTYDLVGNTLTEDGPLAGTADTSRMRYDIARQVIGVIGPDPDGAGAAQHRAQRITHGAWGQVTKVERGAVSSQSDASWNAFSSFDAVETGYDADARPVTSKLVAGGATHALTHMSYDAKGRPLCSTVRMNPAAFASLPPSACDPGVAGSHGPDRITRTSFDAADQLVEVREALWTADEPNAVVYQYTANGRVHHTIDAKGNATAFGTDGHDRPSRIVYPSPTAAGNTNPADYEELSYDSRGNVTSRRLRDGQLIGYSYDALSRLTAKDIPNGAYAEQDVTYAYDLLGRATAVTSPNGHFVNFAYDALGRVASETSHFGQKAMQYDLAGRMTRLTWPDQFFVTYEHNLAGQITGIYESGSVALAGFGYDDLGRRTVLSRGNGAITGYAYDSVSRLSDLSHDAGATANDTVFSFAYTPASQIVSRTTSNDAYAWTGHRNSTVSDSVNGLNEITQTGSTSVTHDARGNVTGIGGTGYAYTSENRLADGGGTLLSYDPLGRLHQTAYPTFTRFDHLGGTMISELDGGNAMIKRYVHGPGVDEPLVEYSGPGLATKRWLHADERGSIVALSDAAGTVTAVNRYDEYGQPQGTLAGRFGYTGQAWLPEIGLSYYKARMYNPALGRFMQSDPIGYGDGINLYDYVSGDPVNLVDPYGLFKSKGDEDIVVTARKRPPLATFNFDPQFATQTIIQRDRKVNYTPGQGVKQKEKDKEILVSCDAICKAGKLMSEVAELANELDPLTLALNTLLGYPAANATFIPPTPIPNEKLRATTVDTSDEIRRLRAEQEARKISDRYNRAKGRWGWIQDLLEVLRGID